MPLVLIAALCRDKSNPFGDTEKCSQDGNAYISFGQWVSQKLQYPVHCYICRNYVSSFPLMHDLAVKLDTLGDLSSEVVVESGKIIDALQATIFF